MIQTINSKYSLLPDLNNRMLAAHATNEMLAEKAGVATVTVANARAGKRLYKIVAECIDEALDKCKFEYCKRGPKGPR